MLSRYRPLLIDKPQYVHASLPPAAVCLRQLLTNWHAWGPEQATAAIGTDFAHSAMLSDRLPFTIEYLLYLHRFARHSLLRPSLVSGMCFRHKCLEERGLLCHFSRASCNSNCPTTQGKVITR